MPSFDIVSEVDSHELDNAIDQANREVSSRFDFKGSDANFKSIPDGLQLYGNSAFQLDQMLDVLWGKASKRGLDLGAFDVQDPASSGKGMAQVVRVKQGIDSDTARTLVKFIKERRLKVQAAIQGDKVRVTGKKRDDLQAVISALKAEDFGRPLQFNNFRD